MNGNEVFEAQNIHIGSKIQKPLADPTRDNLTFDGWLVKATGLPYDFHTLVTEALTLEAKFIDDTVDYEYKLDMGKIRLMKYTGSDVDIIIPKYINGVEVAFINNSAFEGLPIETVFIHKGITEVKFFAFRHTSELRSVIFEEGSQILEISQYLFQNSVKLESINIPASVLVINQNAFENTPLLTNITFEANGNLKEIVKNAFYKSGIIEIELPETLEVIGVWAFAENPNLETVELGNNTVLKSIAANAFSNAVNLNGFKLPSSVLKIGAMAFNNNKQLKTFIIEPGSLLEEIGENAFYGAVNLSSIFIPKGVLILEDQAFRGATRLTTVEFEEDSSLEEIGIAVFYGTNLIDITIPKSVTLINNAAFAHSSLTTITFQEDSSLEKINRNAFERTRIKDFLLPKSVTTLGTDLFLENHSLEKFYVEQGSSLTALPSGMFGNNESLLIVVIPNSVEVISDRVALGVKVKPTFFLETTSPKPGFETGWSRQNDIYWGGEWHYIEEYKPYLNQQG